MASFGVAAEGRARPRPRSQNIGIVAGSAVLEGSLTLPEDARAIVVFGHGPFGSRHSPRNRFVAGALADAGFATLLLDLVSEDEAKLSVDEAKHRFDVPFLGRRLAEATDTIGAWGLLRALPIGYFGGSSGTAVALVAAASRGQAVRAVVCRGGRPDLAGGALPHVTADTLLLVGGNDPELIIANQLAMNRLRCPRRLMVVPGASHLFEESGVLERVARLATSWFQQHLCARSASVHAAH